MARQGWGRHSTVATGSDSGDQVSVNSWNADINKAGMLGFTGETLASATSITPTATTIILSGSTNVSSIATTNTAEYDLLYIFTSGTVTLVNTASPSSAGDIKLLANADTDLSQTVPTILIRKGSFWYEYGGSPVTNSSVTFAKIQDLATMKVIGRTAASSGVSSEVAILDEDNMASDSAVSLATQQSIKAYVDAQSHSTVTASSTTTFTNKTIDQDATGNSITNLANASIKASAGIDATKIADGSVTSTEFKYINTLSDNAQTQIDGKSPTAGNTSLVTTGALDTGSITSNFGNINIGASTITTTGAVATGAITAGGTISGNLTGNVTGNTSGSSGSTTGNAATATTSTNVTVADESTDTSCNVLFTTAATGALPPKSGTNLTFNSNTGILTATGFAGPLTGNVTGNASGTAATVTGASQSAITSVGTLTGLTTSGAVDIGGNNIDNVQNIIHDISSGSLTIDFSTDQLQTLTITNNSTFATPSNIASGKSKTFKLYNSSGSSTYTFTFPAWKFVGTKPTNIAPTKTGILTLTCFGTSNTDIVAAYAVEA